MNVKKKILMWSILKKTMIFKKLMKKIEVKQRHGKTKIIFKLK